MGVRQPGRERHGRAELLLRLVALVGLQLPVGVRHERQADAAEALDVALHACAADLAHGLGHAALVARGVGRDVLGPQRLERAHDGGRLRRRARGGAARRRPGEGQETDRDRPDHGFTARARSM